MKKLINKLRRKGGALRCLSAALCGIILLGMTIPPTAFAVGENEGMGIQPLAIEAPEIEEVNAAQAQHIDTCGEDCTGEDCKCLCHISKELVDTENQEKEEIINEEIVKEEIINEKIVNETQPPNDKAAAAAGNPFIKINVVQIENCKVYYSINGGALQEVGDTGVLINKRFNGGFHIMFFAAPNEGYALTGMSAPGSLADYYTLRFTKDGRLITSENITESYAWPIADPNQTTIPESSTSGEWKRNTHDNNYHGFRYALLEGNMSMETMKQRFVEALDVYNCDGAMNFTRNGNTGLDTNLSFIAEKLPTLKKSISKVVRDGRELSYTDNMALEFGDIITYQFAVTGYSTNVNYSDIVLKDETIGYVNNSIRDGAYNSTSGRPWIYTADYELKSEDIDKYEGGSFVNTAALDYKYKSKYSVGSYGGTASDAVSCKINGLVSYVWEDEVKGLPEFSELKPPSSHAEKYGLGYIVRGKTGSDGAYTAYEPIKGFDKNGNPGVWNFEGWKSSAGGSDELWQPGAEAVMPDTGSVVYTGEWSFEREIIDTGISLDNLPYIAIIVIALCGALCPILRRVLRNR